MTFGVLGEGADMTTAERTLPRASTAPRAVSDRTICGLFVGPALAVLLLMVAYPFVSLLYYSTLSLLDAPPGAGLRIHRPRQLSPAALRRRDLAALRLHRPVRPGDRRACSSSSASPSPVAFQRDFRGRDVLFTIAMLPMMLCPIIVGFLWRYMFNSEWGVVNYLVTLLGFGEDRLARRAGATRSGPS